MPEKNLIQFLTEELECKAITSRVLAALIASYVKKNQGLLGTKLYSQQAIATALSTTDKIVEGAWRILQRDYHLIFTDKSNGSVLVSNIKPSFWSTIQVLVDAALNRHTHVGFNHLKKSAFAGGLPGFKRRKRTDLNLYEDTDYCNDLLKEVPGMHDEITKWLSEKMQYKFVNKDIFYTDDSSWLRKSIVEQYIPKRSTLVIINPLTLAPLSPTQTPIQFKNKFGRRAIELTIAELDQYCESRKVPLVYISSPAPYPYDKATFDQIWEGLNALQRKHNFFVLVDDPYQDLTQSSMVFEQLRLAPRNPFYYITPLTILDDKLATVVVVAASVENINFLKKQYAEKAVQVSLPLACALHYWLVNGYLKECETDSDAIIAHRVSLALHQFEESGLFIQAHLDNQKNWFIYLEPREGRISPRAFQRLKRLGRKVIHFRTLNNGHHFKEGILTSLSSFSYEQQQTKQISILIHLITDLIKYN